MVNSRNYSVIRLVELIRRLGRDLFERTEQGERF
jgi:hypothetical protein